MMQIVSRGAMKMESCATTATLAKLPISTNLLSNGLPEEIT